MGSANYSLVARFPSSQHLARVFPEIKKFWKQGCRAELFWQERRNTNPNEFWSTMVKKFPMVAEYLVDYCGVKGGGAGTVRISGVRTDLAPPTAPTVLDKLWGANNNNSLAAYLDFGWSDGWQRLDVDGNIFYCRPTLVWRYADWQPICNMLVRKWGAKTADWHSDEYDGDGEE
jgi:hypothetical protein